MSDETSIADLQVLGQLPQDLTGHDVRIGPSSPPDGALPASGPGPLDAAWSPDAATAPRLRSRGSLR